MPSAFHSYVAGQLERMLRERRVVVWYDPRAELGDFVDELTPIDPPEGRGGLPRVWVGECQTHLVRSEGSFFALKMRIEPVVELDKPEPLLVYVPGVQRDPHGSVLMEIERGGAYYAPQLRRLARNELRRRYTDGEIDELLAPESIGYRDVARLLSTESGRPASLLKLALGEGSSEVLLTRWLAEDATDARIADKGAEVELEKLVQSRLGLRVSPGTALGNARHQVLRYVLINEFRTDLTTDAPAELDFVPRTRTKEEHQRVRDVASTLRRDHGDRYADLADAIERELRLTELGLAAETLGSIDTFRFEEILLLTHAAELVLRGELDAALEIVEERGHSFWLDRDVGRRAQWEACRLAALLGREVRRVRPLVKKAARTPADQWVAGYAHADGWFEVDRAQRALEAWVAKMADEPEDALEKAIGVVRRDHETLLKEMSNGYSAALAAGKWIVPNVLHQTRIYPELVAAAGGRVAYFFVDAMRYEMGAELAQQLEDAEDLKLVPAVAALPSITPIGMAALLPGASASFSVVDHKGKLASRIDSSVMPGLTERMRFLRSKRADAKDIDLGDLLQRSGKSLAKALDGASLIIVRSQSIDGLGEMDGGLLARQIMGTVIGNVARAVRKLAKIGVEHFVITSDHGHQFSIRKDPDMIMDKPGGQTVDQHRRCWAGHGGQTPPACVRVSGSELGYETDLDFVFPKGLAVFKAGGDLAFHHGGISLQEMVVPVLTLRIPSATLPAGDVNCLFLDQHPATITNRMFSVRLSATALLGEELMSARLVLIEPGKSAGDGVIAGRAGMAVGAEAFDKATGVVSLAPSTSAQVGMMLENDSAEKVRIVAQDPRTDAVLAQTDELPVKLGLQR